MRILRHTFFSRSCAVIMFLVPFLLLSQEKAKLTGKITDKDSGDELVGASVTVVGTTVGIKTNVDGIFNLLLEPGTYDLRVTYVGFRQQTVKGVVVKAGQLNRQDIRLIPETVETAEIVVQADVSGSTEGALLTQQRKALTVQDGIAAEQIRKTPDSDAAEAIKRVTGVTVVGGKYVYVRGLGDRYSSTQLNGVNIPSPEPERKTVPFDIIPSNLIENLVTVKTFLPDQPGNFAGGLVKIKTKEFPDQFQLSTGFTVGYNPLVHFQNRINYPGGRLDFLGFDDGLRAVPSGIPSSLELQADGNRTGPARAAILEQFNNGVYQPRDGRYALNQSYNISLGDQFTLFDQAMGYVASISYSNDANYIEKFLFFPNPDNVEEENGGVRFRYDQQIATYNVNLGGILHFNYRLSENDKIGLKGTYNRSGEDETRTALGVDVLVSPEQSLKSSRLRFMARELASLQLTGSHFISWLGKAEFEWATQYATARREEPDNRETLFIGFPEFDFFSMQNFRNQRFYSSLFDQQYDVFFNLSIPFEQWDGLKSKVKIGASFNTKGREFSARRFTFRTRNFGATSNIPADSLFTPAFVERGVLEFYDDTEPSDGYTADETNTAAYFMVEVPLIPQLRFIGGVRVEQNIVDVRGARGSFVQPIPVEGGFNFVNFLPSLNLIYSLSESMNLRASFSQTVAQPEMRELAPFRFDDYISSTLGNPFLTQTRIKNYDFRWEWFPEFGDMFAISLFYKDLINPLERIVIDDVGTNLFFTVINAPKAENFGAEFEIRKKLGFLTEVLNDFTLGLNLTLVRSIIRPPETLLLFNESAGQQISETPEAVKRERPLQGQSPYVLNAKLSYNNDELGLSATILYNIVGPRIIQLIGAVNLVDNIVEQPRNQVDISVSKQLWGNLNLKFNVRNLLDDRFLFRIGDVDYERYFTGRVMSLSLSLNL